MNAIIATLSILALLLSGCEGVTGGDKQADFSIADGFLEHDFHWSSNNTDDWDFTTTLRNDGDGGADNVLIVFDAYNQSGRRIDQESRTVQRIVTGQSIRVGVEFSRLSERIYN